MHTLALILLLAVASTVGFGGLHENNKRQSCHWGFDDSEDNGPSHWGTICSGAYPVCASGQQQSPINVITALDHENSIKDRKITINYPALIDCEFENTGHTLEVKAPGTKNPLITVAGLGSFTLKQFHFHAPSEHRLNGATYPIELHLVHQSTAGAYTVLGFFIAEGNENAVFAPLLENLAGVDTDLENVTLERVELEDLITSAFSYYSYNGSFTTPPCTEGVNWILSDTPIYVSTAQLNKLITGLKIAAHFSTNNRPVQAMNGREVNSYLVTGSNASAMVTSFAVTLLFVFFALFQ